MKNFHRLRFQFVPSLHLLDLKAQKKNIQCKRFLDIPLSLQEQIAMKTVPSFKPEPIQCKKRVKIRRKKLNKLAVPKHQEENMSRSESVSEVSAIIKKCDRLKCNVLTDKKLNRFQKDAAKCYEFLNELSRFNFQKYEQE